MATIVEGMTDTATDKAEAMMGDASAQAKGAWDRSARVLEDMAQFSKGNVEAMLESGRIAAKGFETLGQGAADYARRSFEGTSEAMKTLSQAKSPAEFMKLQGDYARSAFDQLVAEASRSTETMVKLAGDVAQPLSNRIAMAAEKIKVAA